MTTEMRTDTVNTNDIPSPSPSSIVTEEDKRKYLDSIRVSAEDVVRIMNTPQRTDEWLKARKGRLTASVFGNAVGHNPYQRPMGFIKELLWGGFKGNMATEYGTKNEPVACAIYEGFIKKYLQKVSPDNTATFSYPGLIISQDKPWMGVSPDGLVALTSNGKTFHFLLEIKCPFSRKFYDIIPHYYFDQIQGLMAILNLPWCDFIVYTPERTQIKRYMFDMVYWKTVLYPKLENFYMNEYLPRMILKERGLLHPGQIDIEVELPTEQTIEIAQTVNPIEFDFIWEGEAPIRAVVGNNVQHCPPQIRIGDRVTDSTTEQVTKKQKRTHVRTSQSKIEVTTKAPTQIEIENFFTSISTNK